MSSTKYWNFSNPIEICMYERCYQPLWINMAEAVSPDLDHKLIGVYVDINLKWRDIASKLALTTGDFDLPGR